MLMLISLLYLLVPASGILPVLLPGTRRHYKGDRNKNIKKKTLMKKIWQKQTDTAVKQQLHSNQAW